MFAGQDGEAQPVLPEAGGQQLVEEVVPHEEIHGDLPEGAAVQGAQPAPQIVPGGQLQLQQQQPPLVELGAEEKAELRAMLEAHVERQKDPHLLQQLAASPIASEPGAFQLGDLPWPCLRQVMHKRQKDESKFMEFHHLLVPGRGIMEVVVPQAPSCVPEEQARSMYDVICHKIGANCGESLRSFALHRRISYCYMKFWMEPEDWDTHLIADNFGQQQQQFGGPSADSLHAMFKRLPRLNDLYLDTWPATDETLHSLGDTCTDLRNLLVRGPDITGEGLKYLCERCSSLEFLCLQNCPHLTAADLRHALASCPRLVELHHPETYSAVQLAAREAEEAKAPPPSYRLTTLACRFKPGDLPFEVICGSLPYLRNLRAENVDDLEIFYKMKNMLELVLCLSDESNAAITAQLPKFLTSLKDSKLSKLLLYTKLNGSVPLQVNLSQIGEAIPSLEFLFIKYGFSSTSNLQFKESHFSQLQSVMLFSHNGQICELPESFWVQVLSSERLMVVCAHAMPISQEAFSRVAAAAAAAGRRCVFPNLQHLSFCASGWSTRQLTELVVSRAPILQNLSPYGLDPSTKAQCEKLFKEFRPGLKFS